MAENQDPNTPVDEPVAQSPTAVVDEAAAQTNVPVTPPMQRVLLMPGQTMPGAGGQMIACAAIPARRMWPWLLGSLALGVLGGVLWGRSMGKA